MVKIVWGKDQVPIYLCTWRMLKVWCLCSMEKIKDNGVRCAILNNLHIVMYMPIELGENIEAFMTHEINKIIESFTQHLSDDSWTQYFWAYYFQVGMWINSQSIIVVPPCYAYPKIFTPWINVERSMMDLAIPCGYYVSCYKFMDGGASMNATFKLGHTNINYLTMRH